MSTRNAGVVSQFSSFNYLSNPKTLVFLQVGLVWYISIFSIQSCSWGMSCLWFTALAHMTYTSLAALLTIWFTFKTILRNTFWLTVQSKISISRLGHFYGMNLAPFLKDLGLYLLNSAIHVWSH